MSDDVPTSTRDAESVRPDDASGAELQLEQAHLDRAYLALAAMRARTEAALGVATGDATSGDFDAVVTEAHLRHRLRELRLDLPSLAFGRIDPDDCPSGEAGHRIGRRHVETADGEALVVDWRAPVATAFYRATPADPHGLRLRRRYATEGATIEALFDEDFDDPASIERSHGGVPDPLLAELERSRIGDMRDIVATIAAEQDVVIRAPLEACLVVQGGPGTGKTAVGLHRAAFLLFEHRQALLEQGVLVVGPNPTFLRYISQVLPSLGETSVRQATLAGLVGADRDAPTDPPDRARLLGDHRLATVAANLLASTCSPRTEPVLVRTGWGVVTIVPDDVAAIVSEVRARAVPHDVGRTAVRHQLVRLVRSSLIERRGDLPLGDGVLEADLRSQATFGQVLDAAWPSASAVTVARRLLTSRSALAGAAADVLDEAEQRLLTRRAARKASDEHWTEGEAVLLDECRWLVEGAPRGYGHIVVDEAQDLTALGYRAIARRCPSGSLTILGDLAQATTPGAQRSWVEVLYHLGRPADGRQAELRLGYRVPAAILDWANGLLPEAAPDVTPARSIRTGGREPVTIAVPAAVDLVASARAETERLARTHATVGLIASTELHHLLTAGSALPDAARLIDPAEAKGLEFDGVAVIEPAAIVEGGIDRAAGLRLLYVALTRAVQEVTVIHHRPLPAGLRVAGGVTATGG